MSVYETLRPLPNGSVTTFRIVSAVESLYNRFVVWRKARLTETALRGLSDAQLSDIGLHRGEIAEVSGDAGRPLSRLQRARRNTSVVQSPIRTVSRGT